MIRAIHVQQNYGDFLYAWSAHQMRAPVRLTFFSIVFISPPLPGPEGTPYSNGCFYFDMHLADYPAKAPVVKFLSTGQGQVRFNPNLYNCGKVCLSLLGTWSGPGWVAGKSTVLQVLVSIQGLILGVSDPYFNEPGYEAGRGTKQHEAASLKYSANIRRFTLQYCIAEPLQKAAQTIVARRSGTVGGTTTTTASSTNFHDYPEFANVVVRHFAVKAAALEVQLLEWCASDPFLRTTAAAIRTNLAIVVAAYHDEAKQESQHKNASAAAAAALYAENNCSQKKSPAAVAAAARRRAEPELVVLDD